MCVTCGCGNIDGALAQAQGFAQVPFRQPLHAHSGHAHTHAQGAVSVPGRDLQTIQLEAQILGKNQLIAERNRDWLSAKSILALNLVSSPGAGKTTLLERTLTDLKSELPISVIEGDQATSNDAERIRATGVPAVQINTGTGCHLEADMLERAIAALKCRQPGVPRPLRSWRARQSGDIFGDRGRRQTIEVPAHVPGRRGIAAKQGGSAAACPL